MLLFPVIVSAPFCRGNIVFVYCVVLTNSLDSQHSKHFPSLLSNSLTFAFQRQRHMSRLLMHTARLNTLHLIWFTYKEVSPCDHVCSSFVVSVHQGPCRSTCARPCSTQTKRWRRRSCTFGSNCSGQPAAPRLSLCPSPSETECVCCCCRLWPMPAPPISPETVLVSKKETSLAFFFIQLSWAKTGYIIWIKWLIELKAFMSFRNYFFHFFKMTWYKYTWELH